MNWLSRTLRLRAIVLVSGSLATGVRVSDEAPVVARARAGPCQLTIAGRTSSFLATVTGLAPNEPLKVMSNSEGEVLNWEATAEDDGSYGVIVVPLVRGKSFGTARLEVIGQRCRIEASYPWRE